MPERMNFLPRKELLSLEELDRLCGAFIRRGIRKLRLTGGEPLVRRDIMWLVERLSRHLDSGALDELTLTTNGSRLAAYASSLARLGVTRVNVSLDSLRPETYARITRGGQLAETLGGIKAALDAGLKVKINTVALRNDNSGEVIALTEWAHAHGADISFIEVMPMGSVEQDRLDQFIPLTEVRRQLEQRWTLTDTTHRTGGPARYARTDAGSLIGFITPLSHNFCGSCNRVRVTCTGQLFMCLGQDADADLRAPLRNHAEDNALDAAITAAIGRKPKGHDFDYGHRSGGSVGRHMSVTGG
jgi:cyclic pyranopterin phosphate synthase